MTVLGRDGRRGPRPHPLPGPGPTPAPAGPLLAVLLLAQAGVPFTTGLWAKFQVVLAAVSAGAVPLAVIAMVTAAIAAFFYLRVAVLMYVSTPSGEVGNAIADSLPSRPDAGATQIPGPAPRAWRPR